MKEGVTVVEFGGLKATVRRRGDGLWIARWRESGKGRNTTSKKKETVVELAKAALKRLHKGTKGRMLTTQDAELVAELKKVSGVRSPFAWLSEAADAQERLRGQATLGQAVDHYEQSGMMAVERVTFTTAKQKFFAIWNPAGMDSVGSMRRELSAFELEHAGIHLAEITPELLKGWINRAKLDGQVVKRKTINNRRGRWITFLNHGRDLGFLPKNEKHAGELFKRVKEPGRVPPIFTVEQAAAGVLALPEYLRPTFIVGCWMGLRPMAELLNIGWEHFDWQRGYLGISEEMAGKTEWARFVPIPENVRSMLAPLKKEAGLISGVDHIRRISQILREKGVIARWHQDVMRHSSISYAIASGKSIGVVAEQHGNSERVIRKSYRRPLTREDGEQWYSVGLTG